MPQDHESTFHTLRELLRAHAGTLTVADDTPERFCLEATPGPATLAAWGGKLRRPTIPVAWVERRKSYVGYHLMGLNENAPLLARLSPALRARMQGKTCFNFSHPDAVPSTELAEVTDSSLAALRRGGFVQS
ncbi:MAG TPA: hypothetical protein VGM67_04995 [Gemmatimonadaceae bacterium]|jgi:hypothetical protein